MPAIMVSSVHDDIVGAAEDTMVLWPGNRDLSDCEDLRPIIFAHGHSGQENAPDYLRDDCRLLVEAGFVVLSGDFGGTATFGNDAAINGVQSTLDHARANGWCSTDPVITIGFSMGTLTSLNWGNRNKSDWAGHVAVCGAFSLAALHAGNYTTQINAAYDGSYDDAVDGPDHSPVQFADEMTEIPVVTYYSSTDEVVDPAAEASFADTHGNTTRIHVGEYGHGSVPYVNHVGYLLDAVSTLSMTPPGEPESIYESEVLSDNPISFWRMGDLPGSTTVTDISGNNHTGGLGTGGFGGSYTLGVPGLIENDSNTAVDLDDAGIVCPTTPRPVDAITYEAWIKLNKTTTQRIVNREGDFILSINNGQFAILFIIDGVFNAVLGTNPVVGETYHTVATYDGSHVRLYVNGVENTTSVQASGAINDAEANYILGARDTTTVNERLYGTLDEVAIYDYALSPERIAAHYSAAID